MATETQGNLFGGVDQFGGVIIPAKALAKTDGPETSKEAAENLVASGKIKKDAELVLALLKRHPNKTWGELFDLATKAEQKELTEPQNVLRRLNDLKGLGLVIDGTKRKCAARKTPAREWRAT